MQRREFLAVSTAAAFCPFASAETPKDSRPVKSIYESYFPLIVPKTLAEWEARRERIREQILVATGLWPMPKRDCAAVIHSPIEREHYTIEKVYFASRPGHYVTGNLYKPKDLKTPRPGILFAHGHWADGRLYEAPAGEIKTAIETKAEATEESAKYPLQALPATLARRGYVVFAYDMVGYADSTAIGHVAKSGVPHQNGFADVQGELRLQSLMGLQTFNSLAALDFLASLPMVDAKRLGMTGASGGGTQTFITAAIDHRIAAAVPAVMVSTAMQGGCVCENCSLLRVGTGNVEFAALMAPRPMALTAANDWTKEILTKGFPELQSIYALYGKKENVSAKAWLEYGHNYNQKAREYMYSFFAKHFEGKDEAVTEPPFVPVPPKELSVYDQWFKRPNDEMNAADVRKVITIEDNIKVKKLISMLPLEFELQIPETHITHVKINGKLTQNIVSSEDENYSNFIGKALRAMICDELPKSIVIRDGPKESKVDGATVHRAWLGRRDESDVLPTAGVFGPKFKNDKVVLWIHPDGKESLFKDGKLVPGVRKLIDDGYAVLSADLFGTGDLKLAKPFAVNATYAGFTFGYNRSLLAQRVHDILTLICFGKSVLKPGTMHLVGWGAAGPWTAIARAMAGNAIAKTAVDLNQFDFAKIEKTSDEMMLPGALKYGGMSGILSLVDPASIAAFNSSSTKPWSEEKAIDWLTVAIPK